MAHHVLSVGTLEIFIWKLPVGGFRWIEDKFKLSKNSVKNCNEDGEKGFFCEVYLYSISWEIAQYSRWFTILTWKNENWKNWKVWS